MHWNQCVYIMLVYFCGLGENVLVLLEFAREYRTVPFMVPGYTKRDLGIFASKV